LSKIIYNGYATQYKFVFQMFEHKELDMAVLNTLKINENLAYMISDEEYLTVRGLRRTYHSNNIHSVLDEEISQTLGMGFIAGFVGFPNFGMECVHKIKNRIDTMVKSHAQGFPETASELAEMAAGIITENTREKINSRLKYLYGFTMDDVNRNYFTENRTKTEIKQEDIVKKALEIINKKEKSGIIDEINKIEFIFACYDGDSPIQFFEIQPSNCVINPMPSLFSSVGAGADVCNIIFAEFINKTPLQKRRDGIDPVEGLIEMFWAVDQASLYNHQVGGYCHLCIIEKKGKEGFRMFSDHKPKVGSDIVKAYKKGWLDADRTRELIDGLFFKEMPFEEAEEKLFRYASDKKQLDLFLRGYKYFDSI